MINFPFVPKGKLIIRRCSYIWAHYSLIRIGLKIGTSKTINFPFGTKGKLMVLSVPILNYMVLWERKLVYSNKIVKH